MKINITSVEGRLVKILTNTSKMGQNQLIMDLGEFDSGTYFYNIKFDDKITTGTIIKK